MTLSGQRVVVLGGSTGIGFETASGALARGAEVLITGRSEERLAAAKHALDGRAQTRALDATDEAGTRALFAELPGVDHVFVTAGSFVTDSEGKESSQNLREVVDSRFSAALYAARYAGPKLSTGGSLTFMSGTAAIRPLESAAAVSASCGSVEALARGLAVDLAPVRVNALRPGFIDTPFLDGVLGDARESVVSAVSAKLPVGRIGRPEEGAHAVLFLMENNFVTGICLTVDGGGALV